MKSIVDVEGTVNQELQSGNSKFVIFQEVKWPTTGGVDMDALPAQPISVPVSRIREIRPAKTWKTWENTVEVWLGNSRIAVRGTFDEIVEKLNTPRSNKKPRKPFEPFALTPREARIQQMREDGYSMNEIALALNTTALRIAMDFSAIDKKLEAAAASRRRSRGMDEFTEAPHIQGTSSAGRYLIPATEETMAVMRDPNIHPDATT